MAHIYVLQKNIFGNIIGMILCWQLPCSPEVNIKLAIGTQVDICCIQVGVHLTRSPLVRAYEALLESSNFALICLVNK